MITASCKSLILSTSCCVFRVLSATSFTPPFLFHTPLATEPNCPDPRCWCDLRTKYVFVNHLCHAKDTTTFHRAGFGILKGGRQSHDCRGLSLKWVPCVERKSRLAVIAQMLAYFTHSSSLRLILLILYTLSCA